MSIKVERRLMMKAGIFVIAVILLISGVLSAQAQKPCGCEDKEVLLEALKQNQVVRQELDSRMKLIVELEQKAGGKPIMSTIEAGGACTNEIIETNDTNIYYAGKPSRA
jgi:hypothetical protein